MTFVVEAVSYLMRNSNGNPTKLQIPAYTRHPHKFAYISIIMSKDDATSKLLQ